MNAKPMVAAPSLLDAVSRRIFSTTLFVGMGILGAVVVRSFAVDGSLPFQDFFNGLALLIVWLIFRQRPHWFKVLAWVTFCSFLVNIWPDLNFENSRPISSTHILIPLLIMYGTLLANREITIAALAVVLGVYVYTGWAYAPMQRSDLFILTNLIIGSVALGAASIMTSAIHRHLLRALQHRSRELVNELQVNHRLTAVLYHDIANPLSAARGSLELLREKKTWDENEFERLDRMTGRVNSVVKAVRDFHRSRSAFEQVTQVTVKHLWNDLGDLFSEQLGAKEQILELTEGGELVVETRPDLLVNSVLGNLLSNAIKYSPKNALLRLSARKTDDEIEIELVDQGGGIPEEALDKFKKGERHLRAGGHEGDRGHGLWIARFFVDRLGGTLRFVDTEGGTRALLTLPLEILPR